MGEIHKKRNARIHNSIFKRQKRKSRKKNEKVTLDEILDSDIKAIVAKKGVSIVDFKNNKDLILKENKILKVYSRPDLQGNYYIKTKR